MTEDLRVKKEKEVNKVISDVMDRVRKREKTPPGQTGGEEILAFKDVGVQQ